MALIRATGMLAVGFALLASPLAAQELTRREQLAATTADLFDKLGVLAEALEVDAPLLPDDVLTRGVDAALPLLPDEDGREWGSGMAFEFRTAHSTGAIEPDADQGTVLTDARACRVGSPQGEVVYFVRFTRGAVRGHRCITLEEGGSVWGLQSRTLAVGPDRQMTAYYGVGMSIPGDPAGARRAVEERLEQNVALAGTLADYALEMFLAREGPRRETGEDLAARAARLAERLDSALAGFQTP
jgi:hypothetical protein